MLKRWLFVGILFSSGVAFAQEKPPTLHEVATQTFTTLNTEEGSIKERCDRALALLTQLEERAGKKKAALLKDPNMMRSRSARSTLAYLARVGALAREAKQSLQSARKTTGAKQAEYLARAQERIAGIQAASHLHR